MAEPRRVLMTADAVGGVWTYAMELCRAASDIEFVIATMGPRPTEAQRAEVPCRLVESDYKLEWQDEPWADVAAAGDWLLALETLLRPDVVHLNGYAHAALPWRAPVLAVGHSCVASWWRAVRGQEAPPEWNRYREAVGRGLRAATAVVAPTRSMLDSLARDYGPLPASAVIANGRSGFAPAEKRPYVLAAGRLWDEAKNLAALDEVAPRLSWPVLVAGDCGERRPRHAVALGRLGARELAVVMSHAAIYALPARYEPFGLSALEAALSGCALVLGDIPSLREVWGEAAWFVPPDDPRALADALAELTRDGAARHRWARAARARAETYSPARMAESYRSIYRALARRQEVACA